jgi:hypothetical protein
MPAKLTQSVSVKTRTACGEGQAAMGVEKDHIRSIRMADELEESGHREWLMRHLRRGIFPVANSKPRRLTLHTGSIA